MTPAELKWHHWLMAMSIQESKSRTTAVEYVTLPTIEGLLRIEDPSTAYFEWYSLDGKTYGFIIIDDKSGGELNLDWARAICQGTELRQP